MREFVKQFSRGSYLQKGERAIQFGLVNLRDYIFRSSIRVLLSRMSILCSHCVIPIPLSSAGLDYIAVNKILDFAPGVTMQTVRITILDDLGRPRVEGLETFQVVLRMPMGAIMGEPSSAVITINDTVSDGTCVQTGFTDFHLNKVEVIHR